MYNSSVTAALTRNTHKRNAHIAVPAASSTRVTTSPHASPSPLRPSNSPSFFPAGYASKMVQQQSHQRSIKLPPTMVLVEQYSSNMGDRSKLHMFQQQQHHNACCFPLNAPTLKQVQDLEYECRTRNILITQCSCQALVIFIQNQDYQSNLNADNANLRADKRKGTPGYRVLPANPGPPRASPSPLSPLYPQNELHPLPSPENCLLSR